MTTTFIQGTSIRMIETLARNHGWDGSENLYLWLSKRLADGKEAISIVTSWEEYAAQGA